MVTESEAMQYSLYAMIIQTCHLSGYAGQIVIGIFIHVHRSALKKGYRLIQHAGVAGVPDIPARGKGQPEKIVGTASRTPRPVGGCHQC